MSVGQIKINVYEIVGGDSAIAAEDGQTLFSRIKSALDKGIQVEINFANIKLIVSSFLNASIGQLYGELSEEQISANVKVVGMSKDDQELLDTVIQRAKEYFEKKDSFSKAVKENLGDDS